MEIQDPPPPAPMDIQDMLANSLVFNYLQRNSFNDIASEFQKTSGGKTMSIYMLKNTFHDWKVDLNLSTGLTLEHFVNQLIVDPDDKPLLVTSIVYDFLRRKADAKIALEFKLYFGQLIKGVIGLTLEDLMDMFYKKK